MNPPRRHLSASSRHAPPAAADEVRADLHVHSRHSDHPSEWFLRRIGSPESFMEPREIYRRCKAKGMRFVTISDHNTIAGALEISQYPDTFLSAEVTTYFPEDGCKIHCLVSGINEAEFRKIEARRENIYDLRQYLHQHQIMHSITHPLFRVNGKLTVEHVEKLLVLFNCFEGINGARHPRASELVYAIFGSLTPETLGVLADRHGLEPFGPEPWRKRFTGGSDDHSGCHLGNAYTFTPPAKNVLEFLEHLREGRHDMGGCCGTSLKLAGSLYSIAWQYYRNRLMGGCGGAAGPLGELLRRLAETGDGTSRASGWRETARHVAGRIFGATRKRNPLETLLLQEFSGLVRADAAAGGATAAGAVDDDQAFQLACRIGHQLGFAFLRKCADHLRRGELMDSLQSAAALGPLALGVAPYFAAFSTQHKDEPFLQAVAGRFPAANHLVRPSEKKAWVTDTFTDVNGVTRTIQILGAIARTQGRKLTIVTCLEKPPRLDLPLMNFQPVGSFKLPEYENQTVVFPPFLDILRWFEKEKFSEIIISTPGPLGLAALAAGRILGLRVTGIYHTDFPQYARYLTQDEVMEQLTWRYMQWFFGQLDTVFVPSETYRQLLIERGLSEAKLLVMPRGVDLREFNPESRDPEFWQRFGAPPGFVYLYVGRMSVEKNLELLLDVFREVRALRPDAVLVLVGDGPQLAALRRRGEKERSVFFAGCLQHEALAQAYASADVFVFPSTTDTFGNVVLEAQACGLPAVVSDRGGPREIVERHQSGIVVDLTRPHALTEAMVRLHDDRPLLEQLRGKALENARDSRWEAILDQFWTAGAAAPVAAAPEYLRIQNDPSAAAGRELQVA